MILNDVAGRNLLNKFLSLHILRIISVINLPTVRSGYSDFIVGAERSSERKLQKNDGEERRAGGCRAGTEWGYRNRLECRAAFLPLTLHSHFL